MFNLIGLPTCLVSFIAFRILNRMLESHALVTAPNKYSGSTRYKWRNVVVSFLHAAIVAVLGVCCLYFKPQYFEDRVITYTILGEITMGVFGGYLAYDAVDLLTYQTVASTWPIILHHIALVIAGIGFFYTHRLIAYGLLATLAEINSVFLHGRQVLLMYGFSKTTLLFRVNNVFNVVTYIGMRLGSLMVLIKFILEDSNRLSQFWSKLMLLIGTTIIVINVILFYRLLKSDFLSKRHNETDANILINNNPNGKSQ